MKTMMRMLVTLLLCLAVCSVDAQNTIRRKGTTTNKPATTTRTTTPARKPAARKPATRNTYSNRSYEDVYADSVAVAPDDDDDEPSEIRMAQGFPMYGRARKEYVDNADAQKSLKDALSNISNAKTACLTDHKGIFVYGGNGYNSSGLSNDMVSALNYCTKNKLVVNDIALTDIGWWCVVYSDKKYKGNLPEQCKKALDQYIKDGESILSISISENGNYALVTDKHYDASNEVDKKLISVAAERYGHINSVCITNIGSIITCSRGILFWDVPHNVIEMLQKQDGIPTVVRFTDSGTYIALDGKGFKAWYM